MSFSNDCTRKLLRKLIFSEQNLLEKYRKNKRLVEKHINDNIHKYISVARKCKRLLNKKEHYTKSFNFLPHELDCLIAEYYYRRSDRCYGDTMTDIIGYQFIDKILDQQILMDGFIDFDCMFHNPHGIRESSKYEQFYIPNPCEQFTKGFLSEMLNIKLKNPYEQYCIPLIVERSNCIMVNNHLLIIDDMDSEKKVREIFLLD